jgi:hypothetical protein
MIRFLFRVLAIFSLAAAVIFAVLDATRSIASSAPVMTPLRTSWLAVSPDTMAAAQDLLMRKVHPLLWDPVMVRTLELPGFAIFAVLAFLFYAIGHRPERRAGRIIA